ncbi:MAG: 16S ribosomal RNA methyltransferase A, partial [Metallosphaera sp.]
MNYSQNFLVDKDVIRKISDNISTERPLIEIGCGKGNLSEVVSPDLCIEIDQRLLSFLKNYNPIQGDARKLPVLRGQIISSLPYSITYDFFMEIIKINGISRLLLILQEDFVNKVIDYPTFISFILNYYFEINKLFVIPPSSFRPAPRIFSALVSLKRSRQYDQKVTDVIAC